MSPSPADHPRSRGVYAIARFPPLELTGSSPLARGLRRGNHPRQPVVGIIPARAGFTDPPPRAQEDHKDHPRSRGVYLPGGSTGSGPAGSSPLARGLRTLRGQRPASPRIIPARAGFTWTTRASRCAGPDHPRSRGVYRLRLLRPGRRSGSSPLARGLPGRPLGPVVAARIIPARAGFTTRRRAPRNGSPDHPRSRGVYGPPPGRRVHRQGSSPLARGLHLDLVHGVPFRGIIPARAGFTSTPSPAAMPRPDHPRSRGVYSPRGRRCRTGSGSSPLARGLRHT